MAVIAYQGHAETSASKTAGTAGDNDNVAPADRADYDPTAFAAEPGAAARAAGYPRHDGQSASINAGGRIANGSASRG